jgi:hypothetical protein
MDHGEHGGRQILGQTVYDRSQCLDAACRAPMVMIGWAVIPCSIVD